MNKKGIFIVVAIAVVLCLFYYVIPGLLLISFLPEPHSVPLDQEIATQLVHDLEKFELIYEMDDCTRFHKRINGIPIRMNERINNRETGRYYKEVLDELEIAEMDFERFRTSLEHTKLRSYLQVEKYSIFIVDGFLDSSWGYLYSSNAEIESPYIHTGHYTIRIIEDLGDSWYRIVSN